MASLKKDILKYSILPGFFPRIMKIVGSGFVHVAYLMAVIYQSVRLLPANHAYLNPQNMGRYGIRHVIAEAANNLVMSRKNIDQIILFFTILAGFILLLAQFVLLFVALFAQPAFALIPMQEILLVSSTLGHGGTGGSGAQDIAFVILDRVFGLVGIYNSCISVIGTTCVDLQNNPLPTPTIYPFAFHEALHQLLRFYSLGIFAVSVLIILYFVATIVGETASTGTPFGQRYNKAWFPVRLIVFFALLVPLNIGGVNAGLNGAQLITFWTAKFGSNFATNAWGNFNSTLTTTYLGDVNSLIATPNIPEVASLVQFVFLAKVCKVVEEKAYHDLYYSTTTPPAPYPNGIQAYVVRGKQPIGYSVAPGPDHLAFDTTPFDAAVEHTNYGPLTIRFGSHDPTSEKHANQRANVFPQCGEIKIPITDMDEGGSPVSGAHDVQEAYYDLLKDMWRDVGGGPAMVPFIECLANRITSMDKDPTCPTKPDKALIDSLIAGYENQIRAEIPALINQQITNSNWNVNAQLLQKGWAGAAIWYNRIAEMNGDLTTAVFNIPQPNKYPHLMEIAAEQRRANNEDIAGADLFDPILADGKKVNYLRDKDEQIAAAMHYAYRTWDDDTFAETHFSDVTGNIVIDGINAVLGSSGVFEMRRNTDVHPLAQLSALGKSLMESAIRNLAIGFAGEKLSKILPGFVGTLGDTAGSFLTAIGFMTISISFVLYYILPFLPFIYFMFAVSGWIKSIFEAVVAMPLWALAHIRIDGEGLPGPAASNGYFLLLEIFLRPILIVFGLLGSVSIFAAMVEVLNEVWDLVVANAGGFDNRAETSGAFASQVAFLRGPVDEFFFTVMYVIVVYMIGLSVFKLIDLVPNNILRWIGSSVATFQENAGDPAGTLIQRSYSSTNLLVNQIRRDRGTDIAQIALNAPANPS